jgi:predicted transcriptional regulator
MPLGIISDLDFERELNELSRKSELESHNEVRPGRNNKVETPNSLRKVISGEVIEGGDRSEVARAFNISESSISAYLHGATSTTTYNKIEQSLSNHNNKVKEKIIGLTRSKLRKAVRHITDEKLAAAKPGELAIVARNMSAIANDLEPEITVEESRRIVVTVKPRIRQEDEFEVLSISE